MLKEEFLQLFMDAVYDKQTLNLFDFTAEKFSPEGEEFMQCSDWVNELAKEKLSEYADNEKTIVQLTNYGRYWMMKGGYEAYLRDSQRKRDIKKSKKQEKEELLEARLRLTHFRLWGFWLALIISFIGFALSMFNLYMLLKNKN
jgi:hypothetical protein